MTTDWKPSERSSGRFRQITIIDETGSTNADLAAAASAGAPAGQVLIARHQTAGRGRQGRTWFDQPDSSLLMSWSIDIEPALAPLVPLVTGLAICQALDPVVGDDVAALKWPNDVLVPSRGDRKMVGILAEAVSLPGSSELRVIVGHGMNVDLRLEQAPSDVAERAIDVSSLVDGAVDRAALVDHILDRLDAGLDLLDRSLEQALAAYRRRCVTLGRRVRFDTPTGVLIGEATDVADDGSLLLRTDDGVDHRLSAGDAHHIPDAS